MENYVEQFDKFEGWMAQARTFFRYRDRIYVDRQATTTRPIWSFIEVSWVL